jgi:YVTN family beta-propeller protein
MGTLLRVLPPAAIALVLLSAAGVSVADSLSPARQVAVPLPLAPGPTSVVPAHTLVGAPIHPQPMGTTVSNPFWLAYDHDDEATYVAAPPSSVDIVYMNASPNLGANQMIPVGSNPFGVAVDDLTGDIFVTNSGSANVSILSGLNAAPIANVAVGSDPIGVAWDSQTNTIFVANSGSNNVSVINGSTLLVQANVAVGAVPWGVAADSATGQVFVADSAASEVSVLNGTTDAVAATVGAGDEPYGVAYDNVSGTVYVSNQGSANLTVISGSTDAVIAGIPVSPWVGGLLQGLAFDYHLDQIWVGAGGLYVAVIDPLSETVAAYVGTDPSGVAYDSDNGDICVTNTANTTFECAIMPSISSPSTSLTFNEMGLPASSYWSVTVGDSTLNSTATSITFGLSAYSSDS